MVPQGDETIWTHPPFAAEIKDGEIYGRGATDMKGSVAAFAAAAIDFVRENPQVQGFDLLPHHQRRGRPRHQRHGEGAGVDEGATATCPTIALSANRPASTSWATPSRSGAAARSRFIVTVDGKQGHAAYPHKADNPVPKLARLVDRLANKTLDNGNAHFDPSTLAFTSFDVGNPAGNVIPSRAVAKFNIRFSTEHRFQSLKELVQMEIEAVRKEMGGKWYMRAIEGADAFITEPGALRGLVQDAVKTETGIMPKLSTSGGTSDARFVKDYCPVLEFGPTNATIHQTDERISVDELKATARVYRRILDSYFKVELSNRR